MTNLAQVFRQIARAEVGSNRAFETGRVTNVGGKGDAYTCDVVLCDDGVELKHVPIMVSQTGMTNPPDKGDLVVVGFESGDLNRPVVLGRLYHEQRPAPADWKGKLRLVCPQFIRDEGGGNGFGAAGPTKAKTEAEEKQIVIQLTHEGPRQVQLKIPGQSADADVLIQVSDNAAELRVGNAVLRVEQSNGDASVEVSDEKSTLKIGPQGAVSVCTDANVTVEAKGDLTLSAQGTMSLKGQVAQIEASSITIKGMTDFQM